MMKLVHLLRVATTTAALTVAGDPEIGSEVRDYLTRYGYIVADGDNEVALNGGDDDDNLRSAVRSFQRSFGLSRTGRIDEATLALMRSPRCGNADVAVIENSLRDGSYLWTKSVLRWTYGSVPANFDIDVTRAITSSAFRFWGDRTPFQFEETDSEDRADIKIGFHEYDHGDDKPFDGPNGVLGHAFFPWSDRRGSLHLDGSETWSLRDVDLNGTATNLFSVIVHEVGHALGLRHQFRTDSVMFPFYQFVPRNASLGSSDRELLNRLYANMTLTSPTPEVDPRPVGEESSQVITTVIRGDLHVFKRSEFWRYGSSAAVIGPLSIDTMFAFPASHSRIERLVAVYERFDKKIVLLADNRYYLFDGRDLVVGYPKSLLDFAIRDTIVRAVPLQHGVTYFLGARSIFLFSEYSQTVLSRKNLRVDESSNADDDDSWVGAIASSSRDAGHGRAILAASALSLALVSRILI